jgi:hypothetical protein
MKKIRTISVLLMLAYFFIGCGDKTGSKEDSQTSPTNDGNRTTFLLAGDYYYNQHLDIQDKIVSYRKSIFGSQQVDSRFWISTIDLDKEGCLKTLHVSFGNLKENGDFEFVNVNYNDFLSEFTTRYRHLDEYSNVVRLHQQEMYYDNEYHKAKLKYEGGYNQSEEMKGFLSGKKHAESLEYFLSNDNMVLAVVPVNRDGGSRNTWDVSTIFYYYVNDWTEKTTQHIQTLATLKEYLLQSKQGF